MARSIIYAAGFVALIPATVPGFAQQAACGGDPIGEVVVAAVTDGRTFLTTDSREVRLADVEAPPGAKAALEALVAAKTVTLRRSGTGEDRYGRIVAYAYLGDASIQQQLLGTGNAYVAAGIASRTCADALFAAEKPAREARRGLWADPELGPKSAANRDEISRLKGRFTVIEGRVLSVRDSGGAVYLNFGRQYTRDFSVMVPRRYVARFPFPLQQLDGNPIRVRGIVDMRRGPIIEVERPEQIEFIQ